MFILSHSSCYPPDLGAFRCVTFTLQSNKKKTVTEDMEKNDISLLTLHGVVRKRFIEFEVADFKLLWASTGAPIESEAQLAVHLLADKISLLIESDCLGFSDFTLPRALAYAGVSEAITNDSKFPVATYDDSDIEINEVLEHAFRDVKYKIPIFGPIEYAQSETTIRELIGPMLVAAAGIAKKIRLQCEMWITGRKGTGPVDYAAIYNTFSVMITEAKKNDVPAGLRQNIAQIVAGRDVYIHKILGKRKLDDAALDVDSIPSFGVVSTADKWIFTLFEGHALYCSRTFSLVLSGESKDEGLRSDIHAVIRRLVGILQAQKDAVDTIEHAEKKHRVCGEPQDGSSSSAS